MKKRDSELDDWLLPEYNRSDLGPAVRGKYYKRLQANSNIVVLDPEVAKVFKNGAAVNAALKGLIEVARSTANSATKPPRRPRQKPAA